MDAEIRSAMTKRVAELRRFSSTHLLGLFGALLRIAVPSVDLVGQVRMHRVMWCWSAEAVTRSIASLHGRASVHLLAK
jgi:hypothetical protein